MTTNSNRRAERGFSLAEILTATAIFAVIFIAALMVYDRSNRVYQAGVEASDVQQNTRVAFDRLVAELRMTGFDYDRDGSPLSSLASPWRPSTPYSLGNLVQPNPPNGFVYMCVTSGTSSATAFTFETDPDVNTVEPAPSVVRWENVGSVTYQQPDEQVEFAGPSAVVIRANFDYEWELGECTSDLSVSCENGREQRLQSAAFPVVTTGNDEIVAYALKPANPPVGGGDTLRFYADMTEDRRVHPGNPDATEQEILIPGVDLCDGGCNNPPYTLYRFTWTDSGNRVETPIADNIRDMRFGFFKDAAATAANEITDYPGGEGQYEAGTPDAIIDERDLRAEIRAMRITLVGMVPRRDPAYVDPNDSIAPNYRKYQLETLIVPRNIGRHGMREFASTAPGAPELRSVCTGSCNAVYMVWTPPLTGGDVETYNILYQPENNPCEGGTYTFAEDAGRNLDGYAHQWMTPGQRYRFAVQAVNKYGATMSNCMSGMVTNTTRPLPPTSLHASGGDDPAYPELPNQVALAWPRVNRNETANSTIMCNETSPRPTPDMPSAERRHYRIYRSTDINFIIDDPLPAGVQLMADENTVPQPMTDEDFMRWTDTKTANCIDYYYRVQTVDWCASNATWNAGNNQSLGESSTVFPPVGQEARRGRAVNNVGRPAAPTGFALTAATCSGGLCNFTLRWAAVTADEGAEPDAPPIHIDRYEVRIERILDPLNPSYTLVTNHTTSGGVLEYTFTGIDEPELLTPARFIVRAMDCREGADSSSIPYPCEFGGVAGDPITVTTPVSFGGTGTEADPLIINDPAVLNISSTVPMDRVEASFFQGGLSVGTADPCTGTAFTTCTINIPTTAPDSVPTEVLMVFTDSLSGCTVNKTVWVIDPAAPGCALIDKQRVPAQSPPVEIWSSGNDRVVTYNLYNESDNVLTVDKVIINWTQGARKGAESLTSVVFPSGTKTLSPACTLESTVVTAPTPFTIPARDSVTLAPGVRTVTVNFTRVSGPINANPITGFCVRYRVPFGDQLLCAVSPSAGTCEEPTSSTTSCLQ